MAQNQRRWGFVAAGLLLVGLAVVGAVELALFGYYAATDKLDDTVADLGMGIRSWNSHHAMRPLHDGPGDPRGLPRVVTNSFGLRGDEPAVPKPAATYRILFLGDSFTFGWKVGRDERFAAVCARRLRHRDGRRLDPVNAGVASYCPLLCYLQYRHHLHVLQPDLVVLAFDMSDVQDTHFCAPYVRTDAAGTPLVCTEPSLGQPPPHLASLNALRWIWRYRAAHDDPAAAAVTIDNGARGRYLWTLDDGPEWAAEAAAAFEPIGHLQALLAHDGIPLVVVTYPYPWQVSATATAAPLRVQLQIGDRVHRNDRPFRMLADYLRPRRIPLVDTTAAFRAHPDPDPLYLGADPHFTAAGHVVCGAELARGLAALRPELVADR